MKRLIAILLISYLANSAVHGQYTMDFGLSVGASTYIGEIGNAGSEGFKPFIFYAQTAATNLAVGGFFRYNFNPNIAAKVNVNWVRVAGADSLSDEPSRIARNLSFRTDIFEFSATGEYNFYTTNVINRRQMIDFAAFGYLGFGYILFNPTAEYEGQRYDLRPLATEGIQNEYGSGTVIIPMGVGFHFTLSKKTRIGMDFGYRFTFTDYIDDVSTTYAEASELPFVESTYFANRSSEAYEKGSAELPDPGFYRPGARRGNPDKNDGYFTASFQISHVINFGRNTHRLRINQSYDRRRNGIKRKKYWK